MNNRWGRGHYYGICFKASAVLMIKNITFMIIYTIRNNC